MTQMAEEGDRLRQDPPTRAGGPAEAGQLHRCQPGRHHPLQHRPGHLRAAANRTTASTVDRAASLRPYPGAGANVAAAGIAATLVLILMTTLQVILGELLPKTVALRYPETVALATVLPMKWSADYLLKPLILLLNGSGSFVLRLLGLAAAHEGAHVHSPEEIVILVAGELLGVGSSTRTNGSGSAMSFESATRPWARWRSPKSSGRGRGRYASAGGAATRRGVRLLPYPDLREETAITSPDMYTSAICFSPVDRAVIQRLDRHHPPCAVRARNADSHAGLEPAQRDAGLFGHRV